MASVVSSLRWFVVACPRSHGTRVATAFRVPGRSVPDRGSGSIRYGRRVSLGLGTGAGSLGRRPKSYRITDEYEDDSFDRMNINGWELSHLGMKTDRIRTDITDIIFVFTFLVVFGFEYG
jgi:hypothetical protein